MEKPLSSGNVLGLLTLEDFGLWLDSVQGHQPRVLELQQLVCWAGLLP